MTMPRKCSVIGCGGDYEARKGEHADVNKVSVTMVVDSHGLDRGRRAVAAAARLGHDHRHG